MATLARPTQIQPSNGVVRIVIADNHALFRTALKRLLRTEPDFQVVAEAESSTDLVALLRKERPEVVLLDLDLLGRSGLDTLREIRKASPLTLPLLLVDEIDDHQMVEALCLGARGVALKTTATNLLFKSIRAIMAGEYWLERNRISLLIQTLNYRLQSSEKGNGNNIFGLTPREIEFVAGIVAGERTREIAARFCLSEITVRHHLTNIYRKLRVRNRAELLSFAMRHSLGGNGKAPRAAATSRLAGAHLRAATNRSPRRGDQPENLQERPSYEHDKAANC